MAVMRKWENLSSLINETRAVDNMIRVVLSLCYMFTINRTESRQVNYALAKQEKELRGKISIGGQSKYTYPTWFLLCCKVLHQKKEAKEYFSKRSSSWFQLCIKLCCSPNCFWNYKCFSVDGVAGWRLWSRAAAPSHQLRWFSHIGCSKMDLMYYKTWKEEKPVMRWIKHVYSDEVNLIRTCIIVIISCFSSAIALNVIAANGQQSAGMHQPFHQDDFIMIQSSPAVFWRRGPMSKQNT